jgi:class 3 adenylate cyclase
MVNHEVLVLPFAILLVRGYWESIHGDWSRPRWMAAVGLGALGAAFNEMTDRLSGAYADLETKNTELGTTLKELQESRQRLAVLEQLKGELSKFVPESVKRLLEENPDATELEKRNVEVSIVFLDIAGYTKLSEQIEPRKLNQLVQTYFSSFLEIIQAHHGDINETAGDGLMVIFQPPRDGRSDHALNAARAAFAIRQRTIQLNEEYSGMFPPVAALDVHGAGAGDQPGRALRRVCARRRHRRRRHDGGPHPRLLRAGEPRRADVQERLAADSRVPPDPAGHLRQDRVVARPA